MRIQDSQPQDIQTPWKRIHAVMSHFDFTSIAAFAKQIGVGSPQTLYQIKRGNNEISRELAIKITNSFPAISRAWMLMGEGEMLAVQSVQPVAEPLVDSAQSRKVEIKITVNIASSDLLADEEQPREITLNI